MNKNITIGIIVIITVMLVGYAIFGGDNGSTSVTNESTGTQKQNSEEQFDQVPQFSLKDFDGIEVATKDFKGKVLVLNMWATWCPFCVDELPDFAKLQTAFPESVAVVAINRAEPLGQTQLYIDDQLHLTGAMVYLLDPSDSFYKSIGGFSMPETLFVDREGNIRLHKRGPLRFEEMKEIVESILTS